MSLERLERTPFSTLIGEIITGKKSVLSYLLKPVLKAKSYAFTER